MSSWQTVYKSTLQHQAAIVKDVLANAQIQAVIIDKQDQNYKIGHLEVLVNPDQVLRAIKLIEDEIDFA